MSWFTNKGQSVGLLPGRQTIGPIALMVITPIMGLLMIEANFKYGGSYQALFADVFKNPVGTIMAAYKTPSWETIKLILYFMAFELFLMRAVPGKKFIGPISAAGNRPEYKANGFQCFIISVATFLIGSFYFKWWSPTIIYDHYPEMCTALNVGSFIFCGVLYLKGHFFPSDGNSGSCGNPVIDFYWGMELYPRFFGWDVKQFTNCRWGMMAWAIFPISFAAKNMELNGGELSLAMAVNVALNLVYVAKFFWWETGYLATMDIQHDRAGYYICWGCLVWIPSLYVTHSLYLVRNSPAWFNATWAVAVFAIGWLMVYINYDADRQRGLARATNGDCEIWGHKAKVLPVKYKTDKGEVRDTILLIDGWWKVSRHFHYVPEILAAFCWSLPGGFSNLMPYSYVIFLTVLLVDRAYRDEARMSSKYGAYWPKYCKEVPYKIIPGIL
jgi:7-dehydrocholesterol reductase